MTLRISAQTMSAILTLPHVFIVNGITMLRRDHDASISKYSSDLLTPLLLNSFPWICHEVADHKVAQVAKLVCDRSSSSITFSAGSMAA
jgi:hypothetical protein